MRLSERQVTARLTALAATWELPERAPEQLRGLLRAVADEPSSITAIRAAEQGVELHVADSLAGLAVPAVRAARRVADLGSGGGFPGLVLAIALPQTIVVLVESVSRKCAFLRATAEELELGNVEVAHARAEEWNRPAVDVVTARALAPLPVLAEYGAPLLRDGGVLVAWKGRRDAAEERSGAAAAAVVGLQPAQVLRSGGIGGAEDRWLHVYLKVGTTPSRFPRRPGMARKRPLGG